MNDRSSVSHVYSSESHKDDGKSGTGEQEVRQLSHSAQVPLGIEIT
jgi:hypothetical protein